MPIAMVACGGTSAHTRAFPPELDDFQNEWFSKHLRAMSEPPLFTRPAGRPAHAYRFLWLRTFHHPIAVRLEILADGSGILTVKEADGKGGYEPGRVIVDRTRVVSAGDVRQLLALLADLDFWTLEPHAPMEDLQRPKRLPGVPTVGSITYRPAAEEGGAIRGRVLDVGTGEPAELATVVATSPALPGERREITGGGGEFAMQGLPPGHYALSFSFGGPSLHAEVNVVAHQIAEVDATVIFEGQELVIVTDGAEWVLEGVRGGAYHVAVRQGPDDRFYRDGMRFRRTALWLLDHSGLEIPEKELY